jgi:serine/threonine-protein kinase
VDGGWILLPDGSQIGVVTWNGTPVSAPPLDPAFLTTIVNGVGIDAVPVLPGPRAGGRG